MISRVFLGGSRRLGAALVESEEIVAAMLTPARYGEVRTVEVADVHPAPFQRAERDVAVVPPAVDLELQPFQELLTVAAADAAPGLLLANGLERKAGEVEIHALVDCLRDRPYRIVTDVLRHAGPLCFRRRIPCHLHCWVSRLVRQ